MRKLIVLLLVVSTILCFASCNQEPEPEPAPAHEHSWDAGTVTTAATCTAAGVKTYHCTGCDETKTEAIPATGHTSVEVAAVAATCTEAGKTAGHKCSVCNEILDGCEAVAALGHTPVEVAAVPATCLGTGKTAGHKCSVCDEILDGCEDVPATGVHTLDENHLCSVCGHYVVSNAAELAAAVANAGAYIEFANDITWNATSSTTTGALTLSKNCIIDLCEHTLKSNAESAIGSFMIYTSGSATDVTIKNGTIDASNCSAVRADSSSGKLKLDTVTGTSGKYFMVTNKPASYSLINSNITNLNTAGKGAYGCIVSNNASLTDDANSTYLIDGCTITSNKSTCLYLNDYKADTANKSVATVKNTTLTTDYNVCTAFTRFVDIAYEDTCVFTGVKKAGYTTGYTALVPEGIAAEAIGASAAKADMT